MTQLINSIYVTREWPRVFIEVTMIALISIITHTARIVASILRRTFETKTEVALGADQFGFRRGKETRDAIGILRIISK
jgi:hypothetical protein